jgi:hypothetical protein
MANKKLFSTVRKPASSVLCGDETTTLLDQPAENNVHVGEAVAMVDDPLTIPSAGVDNEATADVRRKPNLEHKESTISYAEIRYSLESEPFR